LDILIEGEFKPDWPDLKDRQLQGCWLIDEADFFDLAQLNFAHTVHQ